MCVLCLLFVSWCWRLRTDALMICWSGSDSSRRSWTSRMCASGRCKVRWGSSYARIQRFRNAYYYNYNYIIIIIIFSHFLQSHRLFLNSCRCNSRDRAATMTAPWSNATHQSVSKARKASEIPSWHCLKSTWPNLTPNVADHLFSRAIKTLKSLAIKMKESNHLGVTLLLSVTPKRQIYWLVEFLQKICNLARNPTGIIQLMDTRHYEHNWINKKEYSTLNQASNCSQLTKIYLLCYCLKSFITNVFHSSLAERQGEV